MKKLMSVAIVALLGLAACDDHHAVAGAVTGATCPQGSTLTYTNFGKGFLDKYCVECHDANKTGAARKGAPEFHDFDTLSGFKSVSDHADEYSGSGPSATNVLMPEVDGTRPIPTTAERAQLSQWIACGSPN
jgi:cytochrome c5